jgi:arylsulfatase A-like enzyme
MSRKPNAASKCRFASAWLIAITASGLGCGRNPPDPPEPIALSQIQRPNIIFVLADDHASHSISAYGSRINATPNIDRLASQGMLFRNSFCTNAICGPSRAVILTGKHSHLNGVMENNARFDGSRQTFPKLLRNAGYQTAIIGKWHLYSVPTGFDDWYILPGQGNYYNPQFKTPTGLVNHTGYVTDIITDLTLDWLKTRRDPKKPFMLMYQQKAPHREWAPGPNHLTMYDDVTIPEPLTLFDDYVGRSSAAKLQEMTIADHLSLGRELKVAPSPSQDPIEYKEWKTIYDRLNDRQRQAWDDAYGPKNELFQKADLTGKELVRWKYQRYIKDYLRCVASVDDNLGRLLDHLDETGLADNTVVVYTSDHGYFLGDHGWFGKQWMYEESLRIPLIVRWPGVTNPGSKNNDLVQNLDFAQTFLDMAGVKPPADMQGRSLVPLLKGTTPPDWRKSIYYHYSMRQGRLMVNPHYGVRTERHKLIHYHRLDEWELFDLQEDPNELTSVYDKPAYAQTVKDLKSELERLQLKYGDINPKQSPRPCAAPS